MATQPPLESPAVDPNPVPAASPSPDFETPGGDFDQPSPGTPAGDAGTQQPLEI